MIHYFGTPITPRSSLLQLAGRSFCVSFAAPRDLEVCHEIGESVMLDNGAYSFWTQRRPTDWPAFYDWCEPWLAFHTTWAVIPDVIDGAALWGILAAKKARELLPPPAWWTFPGHDRPAPSTPS